MTCYCAANTNVLLQVRYSRLLEEGDFRGRTANYVLMLMFGIMCISLVAVYTNVHFLGSALTFMMVYVWGRRNEDVRMSFLGFFTFNAPYGATFYKSIKQCMIKMKSLSYYTNSYHSYRIIIILMIIVIIQISAVIITSVGQLRA